MERVPTRVVDPETVIAMLDTQAGVSNNSNNNQGIEYKEE